MQTLKLLDDSTITFAYTFLRDCEDENPIGRGVDDLAAYPISREGVHQGFASSDIDWQAWRGLDIEDRLIARIDSGESLREEEPDWHALAAALVEEPEPLDATPEETSEAADDPCESMPVSLGMGRMAAIARR